MPKLQYFIINKPCKVLSQFSDEDGNSGLGSLYKLPKDVYPVGRLDLDSEGLLILTNDKALNHKLLSPQFEHKRTYWAEVEGKPGLEIKRKFSEGIEINLSGRRYRCKPAEINLMDNPNLAERDPAVNRIKHPVTSWLAITLTEGKNRQVRKMTAKAGFPTLRLIRVAIEQLQLGDLGVGDIRQISQKSMYSKLSIKH